MARRRWSESERREILAAQEESGLSAWSFARAAGVPYTTLAYWKRHAGAGEGTARFVPVEIERESVALVELVVGDVVVRVGADFDDAHLVRVVRALRAC